MKAKTCPWCGKPAKVVGGKFYACSTDHCFGGKDYIGGAILRLWNKRGAA